MSIDPEDLKGQQGANITYLRWVAESGDLPSAVAEEVARACDDIAAYREIVGLVKSKRRTRDEDRRLIALLDAMTWQPGS